jgi:hypothetical protein
MDSLPIFYEYLGKSLYVEKGDKCYICEENSSDIILECEVFFFNLASFL